MASIKFQAKFLVGCQRSELQISLSGCGSAYDAHNVAKETAAVNQMNRFRAVDDRFGPVRAQIKIPSKASTVIISKAMFARWYSLRHSDRPSKGYLANQSDDP